MSAQFPHLAVDGAPLLLFGALGGFVLTHLEIAELFLKSTEALEPLCGKLARGGCGDDRAPRLVLVSTVSVAAVLRELRDIVEGLLERAFVRP